MLENFFPVTSTIGLFQRDADVVAHEYVAWQRPILAKYEAAIESRPVEGPLQEVIRMLLPLTSPIRERFLFLHTSSPWSAFLDNFRKGTDAATPVHYLSRRLRCRGVRITSVPDPSSENAGTILEVCEEDGSRRTLYCAKDGGRWKFGATGEPLPFEDVARYEARRVRDRFPPELALDYLRALGIEMADESFYTPEELAKGVLVTRRGRRPASFREYSVEWGPS
ncbi:MAG: hypothetical protein MJE66_07130 [Proteobacteria bacterium]|nr:hypothetical protein [Pseudomonadota bacterium]